jgi:hypothetical protein
MATQPPDPERIAETLVRTYGDAAMLRAETLVRRTFLRNTAETSHVLAEVLKAIDKVRSARPS